MVQISELSKGNGKKKHQVYKLSFKVRKPSSMEESDFYLALNLQVEDDKKREPVDALVKLEENNRKKIHLACIFSMQHVGKLLLKLLFHVFRKI